MNISYLTDEQNEIIKVVKQMCMNEVLKINAFAGTGKTSTLIAVAESMPSKRFLYLAFNSSIVEESKKRFPKNVTIITTHALAYRKIVAPLGATVHPDYKPVEVAGWYEIDFTTACEALNILNDFFASDRRTMNTKQSAAHEIAFKMYLEMVNGTKAMTHSFYLKQFQLIENKGIPSYDYVLLDEYQDTNDVTFDICMSIEGAKILVGDTHQSIYGWRGAENAMSKVEADFNLYLTKTFRCTQAIVDRANYILARFKGEKVPIISASSGQAKDDTYAVITRTNAKLIENLAEFDDDYKIIKHPEAIFSTAINLQHWLAMEWEKIVKPEFEYLKKFRSKDALEKYIADTDSLELKSSLAIAKRYKKGIYLIYSKAYSAYKGPCDEEGKPIKQERDNRIVLLTGHSSKGLEFDRVDIETDFPQLSEIYLKSSKSKKEIIEEANLYYVATTRAKHILNDSSKNDSMFFEEY